MSILHYYLSFHFKKIVNFDNSKPHCMYELPSFYSNCKNVYSQCFDIINDKPHTQFYNSLISNSIKNINNDIPRLEPPFTAKHIFPILHNTKKTTPTQKQITFRLIHGITGTTNHQNKFKSSKQKKVNCTICKSLPETENHLFTTCPSLSPLRIELIRLLRLPHNTLHNRTQLLHRAIFLNIYPFNNKAQSDIRNIVLAHYRETIWQIRNSTKWDNKSFSQQTIVKIFKTKLKLHLEKYTTQQDWELFYSS